MCDLSCLAREVAQMADDQPEVEHPKAHSAPEVVAATNRVNVALPFSSIDIEESSRDLAELAVVVADLVTIVEGVAPGPKVKRQRERAQMLATKGSFVGPVVSLRASTTLSPSRESLGRAPHRPSRNNAGITMKPIAASYGIGTVVGCEGSSVIERHLPDEGRGHLSMPAACSGLRAGG